MGEQPPLSVPFRGNPIPVTFPTISREIAEKALQSEPFLRWLDRCASTANSTDNELELQAIELQSVDMFGTRVRFIKLKSIFQLRDEQGVLYPQALPGFCFLRGNSVGILVALLCPDDDTPYSLLVEQPRVPIGQASTLELPAGMLDGNGAVAGTAIQEMKEECGIVVNESDLVDLTQLAYGDDDAGGICPSPGGCDEHIRLFYVEKKVTKHELDSMKGRVAGLRNHGELITLHCSV